MLQRIGALYSKWAILCEFFACWKALICACIASECGAPDVGPAQAKLHESSRRPSRSYSKSGCARSKSVRFKDVYCANPVCTPSRASMMTGLYSHHHEAQENTRPYSEKQGRQNCPPWGEISIPLVCLDRALLARMLQILWEPIVLEWIEAAEPRYPLPSIRHRRFR